MEVIKSGIPPGKVWFGRTPSGFLVKPDIKDVMAFQISSEGANVGLARCSKRGSGSSRLFRVSVFLAVRFSVVWSGYGACPYVESNFVLHPECLRRLQGFGGFEPWSPRTDATL